MKSIAITFALTFVPFLVECTPVPHGRSASRAASSHSFPEGQHHIPLKRVQHRPRKSRLTTRTTALTETGYQSRFLAPVTIGGQTVDLDIDTGSSNIWALSQGYTCESGFSCDFGSAIDVDGSFVVFDGVTFETSYGDGSGGTGILANTSVSFDGIDISSQTVGLVDSVGLNGDGLLSGLIGLGYPSGTSASDSNGALTYSSAINTMFVDGLADPLFSIALSRDSAASGFGGWLTIGGIPDMTDPSINVTTSYGSAAIQPNPVTGPSNELSNYVISVDGVAWEGSDGTVTTDDSSFLYLVDSGTTLTMVPSADAQAIAALFQPAAELNSNGDYAVSCDAIPPALAFTVGGVLLNINPYDLILNDDGSCLSGIQPLMENYPIGILGDTVLRSLLAVFDWSQQQVHLASRTEYES